MATCLPLPAGSILPIPEATTRRALRFQDAARVYIHQRDVDLVGLAKRFNCGYRALWRVKNEDDWDGFASELLSRSIGSVIDFTGQALERTKRQLALIDSEVTAQCGLIEFLGAQRDRCVEQLKELTPGTKAYSAAIGSLAKIRQEIEEIVGLDDLKSEVSVLRLDRAKKASSSSGPGSGRVVDL